ncbi:MAG: YitT family protein [Acutalibacteraceae bacterium]|nr:YitT family protein [Oscillospiraceae bacterium]
MTKSDSAVPASKKSSVVTWIVDILFFVVGSSIFALGINMFSVPNNIACGGVTGIATMVNHFFPRIPIGVVMLALNIPLFILAFIFLGRKLFIKSFIATVILSVVTDIFARIIPAGTNDRLLAAIFYGVCSGVGLAIIFMRNATSGGSDIVVKLINKKYPHLSMGRMLLLVDSIVVLASGIAYKNIESALYSAIVVFVSGEVIDLILYGTGHGRVMMIVTSMPQEVSKAIMTSLHRGVTIIPAKGAYTDSDKGMLVCAARAAEVSRINKIVRSVDEHAFTIISEAGEVLGEGFKSYDEEEEK